MAQTVLGIDIGSHSVKVCELTRSLRDFELVAFYEQVISQTQRLTHEEAVAAALRGIFEKNELKADVVAVSLPAHLLSCRVIELPFTNLKKIEQTVVFELESFIPIALEELLVDYHILSIDENRSTVLAAYVPRARFIKYLDMLQVAGVDPKFVGVDAVDLSNIAQIAMVPQEAPYALIDIGHHKTNICVMEGLKLKYVRSITLGGSHFTKAIQKAFKVTFEKAESLKLDRGRVSSREEDLDQVSRWCQKVAEELIVAIRQTYMGFRQIYPDKEWSAVYVTGGGARLQGLLDLLSAALRLNVSTLDCLEFIPHRLSNPDLCRDIISPSLAETLRVIFSNKAVKINFRRGEFAYTRDIQALGGDIRQAGGLFGAVLFLGLTHFLFSYYTLNSRIDSVDTNLVKAAVKALPELASQKKKTAKNMLTIVGSKMSELQTQLDALQTGSASQGPIDLLKEISSKLPPKTELKIDVDSFSFTGDGVRLEGRTDSFESVDKIKSALSESTLFKNVTTQNVIKGIRDEIKFSLSIDIGEKEGGGS